MADPATTLIRYIGDDWTLPFIHTDKLKTPVPLINKTPIIFLTSPDNSNIYELNINNGGVLVFDQNSANTKGRFTVFIDRKVTATFSLSTVVPTGPYIGNALQSRAKLRIVMEDAQGRRKTLATTSIICKEV